MDASALVEYLLRTPLSGTFEGALTDRSSDLHVPALCDIEVVAALRAALMRGRLGVERAEEAVADYLDLPFTRHGHQALLARMLALRDNFSPYDAAYVALAEHLSGALLTGDQRLAMAVAAHTDVQVISLGDQPRP